MRKKSNLNNMKDLILETASTIFSKLGFKKTTMDDIARAIHKVKGSIYYHFKSKEEIFKSIVEKESILMKEEIIKAVEKETTPDKKLKAYVITRIHVLNRLTNYFSALKDDNLEHHHFIKEFRKEDLRDEIQTIKGIISEGVNKGFFEIKDLEVTAITILTALKGLEYPIVLNNKSNEIELNIDNFLEILFNGIRKRK